MTPLKGVDGDIYALAQGSLTIGGKTASRGGASKDGNHVTAGTILSGAIVEREIAYDIYNQEAIFLSLKDMRYVIPKIINWILRCFILLSIISFMYDYS